MAMTASLVFAGRNRLRYLINATVGNGETVSITADGSATPDLVTDTIGGQLKKIARANLDGYGKLAAASNNVANTRALLLMDNSNSVVGAGGNPPPACSRITPRSGTITEFIVDARADGNYGLTITAVANNAASCYLDIFVPGAIGL